MRAFVSYASQDSAIVTEVCDLLRPHGIECWRDREQLSIGDELDESIRARIRSSEIALIFASQHSLSSSYVTKELGWIQLSGQLRKGQFKITLSLDGSVPSIAACDLFLDLRKPGAVEELVAAISPRVSRGERSNAAIISYLREAWIQTREDDSCPLPRSLRTYLEAAGAACAPHLRLVDIVDTIPLEDAEVMAPFPVIDAQALLKLGVSGPEVRRLFMLWRCMLRELRWDEKPWPEWAPRRPRRLG